mmetsp:Transcript_26436/g.48392  ORF Transcript_26436/g.48392 Transcript_26436/m.48392 type:complete len:125 (-) Transcript_26436:18-392(-)
MKAAVSAVALTAFEGIVAAGSTTPEGIPEGGSAFNSNGVPHSTAGTSPVGNAQAMQTNSTADWDSDIPPPGAKDEWNGPAMQQLRFSERPTMEGCMQTVFCVLPFGSRTGCDRLAVHSQHRAFL